MFKKYLKNKYHSGMTLIELMVVLAIFMIILGVTVFNYGSFKSSTSIQNLADDIALSVRKAQAYAIGSKSLNATNGYGVNFSIGSDSSNPLLSSTKSFIIFADINTDSTYTHTSSSFVCGTNSPTNVDECLEGITIKSNAKITDIKIDGTSMPSTGSLDIVFKRPNPDAIFCYKSSSIKPCFKTISNISITVSSPNSGAADSTKNIVISNTGQISVQ